MSIDCRKDFSITITDETVFWNTEQTATAECTAPQIGGPSQATVPAHTYSSEVSQAAADAEALAAAQAEADAGLYCCDPPGDANSLTMTPTEVNTDPFHVTMLHSELASSGSWNIEETSAPIFPTPCALSWVSDFFCNPSEDATLSVSALMTFDAEETAHLPPGSVVFELSLFLQLLDSDANIIAQDSASYFYTDMPLAAASLSINANVPQGRYRFVLGIGIIQNANCSGNFSVSSS